MPLNIRECERYEPFMKNALRRLRGVIGNGIVWATAWAAGTIATFFATSLIAGGRLPPAVLLWVTAANGAALGFASGTVFSIVLGIAYRRRLLRDIRPSSVGVLGVASGVFIPIGILTALGATGVTMPVGAIVANLVFSGAIGWGTSVGSIKLAQSADARIAGSDYPAIGA